MDLMLTLLDLHHPDQQIAALDYGRESWRNKIYPAYKGTRKPPDPAYSEAVGAMRRILDAMCIPCYERANYEADDVIGSLCAELPDTYQKIIISSDKDLLQLVDDEHKISQWDMGQPTPMMESHAYWKMGVQPKAIPDLLALWGDIIDNIPGVAGIGKKQAVNLISDFGTLDNLYDCIAFVKPQKTRTLLESGKDNAFLSKQLATIKTDLHILGETITSNNRKE